MAVAPFENPALATGGHGRRAGRRDRGAARPGPRRRSPPRGSASTSTGGGRWRPRAVRRRRAAASDLPEGLAIARKRLAAVAERQATGKRLGFGVREPSTDGRTRTPRGREPATRACRRDVAARSRRAARRPACRRCRGRPGWSSTSTRCAATSPSLRSLAGGRRRSHPVVKADAYGHGAMPIARALEAAGADGSAWRRSTRRSRCARPASTLPIRVLYPIPPDSAADGRRSGSRSRSATVDHRRPAGGRVARSRTAERGDGRASASSSRSRPAWGAAGRRSTDVARGVVDRIDATPGARLTGLWTHLQASEDPRRTRRRSSSASRRRRARSRRAAGTRRTARRGQRRPAHRRRRLRRRPTRACRSTGSSPTSSAIGR